MAEKLLTTGIRNLPKMLNIFRKYMPTIMQGRKNGYKNIKYGYPASFIWGGCCIEENQPTLYCKSCKRKFKETDMNREFVHKFAKDAVFALQKHDSLLRIKLQRPEVKDFYYDEFEGIGIWSITEPILKYIIFSDLCDIYYMQSEYGDYYGSAEKLDLALFNNDNPRNKWENAQPDVAIEMKWTGFTKKGSFYSGWIKQLKSDVEKMLQSKNKMLTDISFSLRFYHLMVVLIFSELKMS